MKIIISFIFFVLLPNILLICQDQSVYRIYNTQESESNIISTSVDKNEIENHYFQFRTNPSVEERNVNLIFHVLWNNENEKLSPDIIENAIFQLNKNFGSKSYQNGHISDPEDLYEHTFIDDTKIRFSLISQDYLSEANQNNETNQPINYHYTQNKNWSINNDMKFKSSDGRNVILPEKLLNVWIVNLRNTDGPAAANAGFAQMPGNALNTDGVVIDYQFISEHSESHFEYNEGATLTHLIGNYLNLFDLWNIDCRDDKVSDTPTHNASNFGCPQFAHLSSCDPNSFVVEMCMNYMDNTNDDCQYMFTHGQAVRMQAILSEQGYRNKLNETGICEVVANNVETTILNEVTLYPNPANHGVWIEISDNSEHYELTISDQMGKTIYKDFINSPQRKYIDLKSINNPGIYLITMSSSSKIITKKIIIQ